jgi:hypothetical protein
MLCQKPHEVQATAASYCMCHQRAAVRVRAMLQQQANVGKSVLVEGVREVVRVRRSAVLQQDAKALGAFRLRRVVDRFAVVRVRPRLEQDSR